MGMEPTMRKSEREDTWVIYRGVVGGEASGPLAVCGQREWEKYEREHPGERSLVQNGIEDEAVAERLARGTSGDPKPRGAPR